MTETTTDSTELLRLASADNFRDVAGHGYLGADGRQMATAVFFRSNELQLSGEDLESCVAMGIRGVIDLRTDTEVEAHPDREIPGATWRHIDILGIPTKELYALHTHEGAMAMMDGVYRRFVETEKCRAAFGEVLRALAEGGPQVFHCTAGKDRTGWTAALLQHIAGVDDATIEHDYLLTNERTEASRAMMAERIEGHLGPEARVAFEPTLGVELEFLQAAYDAVERTYGDRARYLREGLGLDDVTLDRLRGLLLA